MVSLSPSSGIRTGNVDAQNVRADWALGQETTRDAPGLEKENKAHRESDAFVFYIDVLPG